MDSATPPVGPAKAYEERLAAGRFEIQRCEDCGAHVFYPRYACPSCGSERLAWVAASGRGTVYATTVMHRRPEQGGNFNVALVDLEEGPRLMSRVEGVPPEAVVIGMRVRAAIVEGPEGRLVVFRGEA